MHNDIAAVRGVVQSLIGQYIATVLEEIEDQDAGLTQLWQTIDQVIRAGGKRLRPYLLVLTYEAYGGQDRHSVMPVAASWELLHQALLVHDDIIDHDYERHGQLNVCGKYQEYYKKLTGTPQPQIAESAALIAGNLLFGAAQQMLLTSLTDSEVKVSLLRLLASASQITCYGELLDVEASLWPAARVEAFTIAELKTASYTFTGPMQSGALLAGASYAAFDQLAELGTLLGIAFQLSNDLQGVFGAESDTGKSGLGDLREGKRSRLLQLTYLSTSPTGRRQIDDLLGDVDLSPEHADVIRSIMELSGARQMVEDEIRTYRHKAGAVVQNLPIGQLEKRSFLQFIDLIQ